MENTTSNLLLKLAELNNREEIIQLVSSIHQELKNKLLSQGIKFYDEKSIHPQYLEFEQYFSDSNIKTDIMIYEEVNYIRNGLNGSWVANTTDKYRFDPIQKKIKELKYS
jgi:hypothetical protein